MGAAATVSTTVADGFRWQDAKPGKWAYHYVPVPNESGTPPIPIGVVRGDTEGPSVLVVAGTHGTELVPQSATLDLLHGLDPSEVRGTVVIVLCLDVAAAQAGCPLVNPVDRKNLNRVWPGNRAGTYTEALADSVFADFVDPVDVVIDLHGGEWYEEVMPMAIIRETGNRELDDATLAMAKATGQDVIEVQPVAPGGNVTLSGSGSAAGKKAMTCEVGGWGRDRPQDRARTTLAVYGALGSVGCVQRPTSPFRGRLVGSSEVVRTQSAGILRRVAGVGETVAAGQTVAEVADHFGVQSSQLSSAQGGLVIASSRARMAPPGALVVKLAREQ